MKTVSFLLALVLRPLLLPTGRDREMVRHILMVVLILGLSMPATAQLSLAQQLQRLELSHEEHGKRMLALERLLFLLEQRQTHDHQRYNEVERRVADKLDALASTQNQIVGQHETTNLYLQLLTALVGALFASSAIKGIFRRIVKKV